MYRSEAMMGTEEDKRKTYEDLNNDAAKLIIKNAEKGAQWEKDILAKMQKVVAKGRVEIMEATAIKRAVSKYHDEY